MKAARIHRFGPPDVILVEEIPQPAPGPGEVLVRVGTAGVGPWDALIREKKSAVPAVLPLILGSDVSGTVVQIGPGVSSFKEGDAIYGVTNAMFIGAYAEYAIASAAMIAPRPHSMDDVQAASVPVVAVTAWQMLFDYAHAKEGQSVLILGAAGNVGAYAVQFANHAGLHVIATAAAKDLSHVKSLGAAEVLNYRTTRFEGTPFSVDIVLDMVGGETRERSIKLIKPGGILVSVVSPFPKSQNISGIRTVFFLVEVTTARLNVLTGLFNRRELATQVGSVLPLEQVQLAHEMLAGAPHKRGKIVLQLRA